MQLTSRTNHRTLDTDPSSGHRHTLSPTDLVSTNDMESLASHRALLTTAALTGTSSTTTGRAYNDTEGRDDSKLYRRQLLPKHSKSKSSFTIFPILVWRRWKYQWALLSSGSKVATFLMICLLCQHVIFGVWDRFFYRLGVDSSNGGTAASDQTTFAVAINTYKRPDMLRQAVQHYAETCGQRVGVSQVFIIWAEQHSEVPSPDSFFTTPGELSNLRTSSTPQSHPTNRATVKVLQKSKDSLNSRFEPISQLSSTGVFMVDDDIRVACSSLYQAFQAWKTHPDSMVGYYPRLASPPRSSVSASTSPSTELVYHTWPVVFWKQSFNFVLTKASFLHAKYLDLYTNHFPQEIKDHIDQHMNCEDIAMSLLVANYTRQKYGQVAPPIYVEGSVSDRGLLGGISTGSGHMTTRSDCLTQLTKIAVEKHGWKIPFDYQIPLRSFSWFRHAPGFWWQYRPSNVFEWFALANTFT